MMKIYHVISAKNLLHVYTYDRWVWLFVNELLHPSFENTGGNTAYTCNHNIHMYK